MALLNLIRQRRLDRCLSLDDFERMARHVLPRPIYGYVAGASQDNTSLDDNRQAYRDLALLPENPRDVSQRSQAVTLFGRSYSAPFGIAPMGIAAMSAYRGDIALAEAAKAQGILNILSGSSLIRLEDVVAANPATWFQAYLPGDQARIDALLTRVKAAGVETLMVTVDIPVFGNRENNVRSGFSTPLKPTLRLALDGAIRPGWVTGTLFKTLLKHGMPHFENSFAERGAPIISKNVTRDFAKRDHFDWAHIGRIRQQWKGPFVVKGLLNPADARRARELGVDGIVVSNHGGRQLDGAIAPLRVLPEMADAAKGITVIIDGGIRRGADILKALALGADFALIGRPFNFAAAVGGQAGVVKAIEIMKAEVDRDLAMLGVHGCAEVEARHVRDRRAPFRGVASV
ncbi:MAG TPA: alpha-hydroxy acid oxidase [Hyphomicrobiaceae bacterium]|nr:alpha-hydroxy acid oxidase [Hyphomicrobiaceae bacterium]